MANNRAYLRLADGTEVFVAKFYPSTGWFSPHPERVAKALDQAMGLQPPGSSALGLDDLELVFEEHPNPARRYDPARIYEHRDS